MSTGLLATDCEHESAIADFSYARWCCIIEFSMGYQTMSRYCSLSYERTTHRIINPQTKHSNVRGFTLIEIAFVLLILGLVLKSAVTPLAALREHSLRSRAEAQTLQIRESLFAHVVAYGALPCPLPVRGGTTGLSLSDNTYNSLEPVTGECVVSSGHVPAHELRLSGALNDNGALLDPWGREYRYAVSIPEKANATDFSTGVWTVPGAAANIGVQRLSADLVLCHATARSNCSGTSVRGDQIVFVVVSLGGDSSDDGAQLENLDGDNYYTVAEESVVTGAEYDDIVTWGSAADVMYWMLRMGWLP